MALYSVWQWDRNAYAVYGTDARVSVGDDPSPPRPGPTHVLGADPDRHLKTLPFGARFLTYSLLPRGEIVQKSSLLSLRGEGLAQAAVKPEVIGALVAVASYSVLSRHRSIFGAAVIGALGAGAAHLLARS